MMSGVHKVEARWTAAARRFLLALALALPGAPALADAPSPAAPTADPPGVDGPAQPAPPGEGGLPPADDPPFRPEDTASPADTVPESTHEDPGRALIYLPPEDECNLEEAEGRVEDLREALFEMTCYSARWVDGLFGDDHDFAEREVGGRLRTGIVWNQYDGLDPKLRFSVRTAFPNLSSRLNAFVGRVDEESYISDSLTDGDRSFDPRENDEDAEWLLGLGYDKRKEDKQGWDYSVGIRFRFPPRPYVRARWRTQHSLGKNVDIAFRQTFFWRDGVGFGTTSRFDTSRRVGEKDVFQFEAVGTWSEDTEGVDWWAGHTWYHRLGEGRGLSLLSFARGETRRYPDLTEFGFHLIYRRPLNREWLFLNAGPTLTWPRFEPDEEREMSLGLIAQVELFFGNRYR